ncbi:HDOD domain-containing protein [Aliiglaciecola sp.]|nr:HDOD domain-containing protein [Aliiglaciecola sp.]
MHFDMFISSVAILVILCILRVNRNSEIAHSADRNTLVKLRKTRGVPLVKPIATPEPSCPSDNISFKLRKPKISAEFLSFELQHETQKNNATRLIESVVQLRRTNSMVLSLTRSMTDTKALFDAVRGDPELVAKIINSVNSPLFGLRKPIKTINHAVLFLGVNQVKNIALQFVMAHTLKFAHNDQKRAYQRIGEASLVASSFAFLFAKEMNLDDGAELSTLCLLSYLGDIALVSVEPKIAKYYVDKSCSFKRTQTIQRRLQTNSAQMSQALALKWGLPDDICQYLSDSLAPMNNTNPP